MRSKYDTFVPANPPPEYTPAAAKKENGAVGLSPTVGAPSINVNCPDVTVINSGSGNCPDVTIIQSGSGTKVVDTNDDQYDGLVVITDEHNNDLIQFRMPQDYTEYVAQAKIDILNLTQIKDEDDNLYKLKIKDGALEIVKLNVSGSTVTEVDADFWNSGSGS
jgi:hypothetical protein